MDSSYVCAHFAFHTYRSFLIFTATLGSWGDYAHFTDEKSEAQRGEVTCPKSPSQIQTQVCPTLEAPGLSNTCCLLGSGPSPAAASLLSCSTLLPSRLSGLSPFLGDDDTETLNNVLSANWYFDEETFEAVSDEAKDFVSNLLTKDQR